MKIHLGINEACVNGYLNIDPIGGDGKTVGDFKNLDEWVDTASCYEILAPELLDYIHGSQLLGILQHWSSKLRHGGKLIIGGTDIYELCKGVVCRQLNIAELNQTLFSMNPIAPFIKLGAYTWPDIEMVLTQMGLKVLHRRINNRKFIVEAYRE